MNSSSNKRQLKGMAGFGVIWVGQAVSILGSSMTGFGLTIWAYELTGRATDLALIGFFFMVPMIALSPISGVLVDRYNRKLMMGISDAVAALVTVWMLVLHLGNNLEIWHLYVGVTIISAFGSVQWPAYSAAITMMLHKDQYTRANSLLELAGSGAQIIAPLLAGAALPLIGMRGIFIVDIVTASFAVVSLLFVFIPEPEPSEVAKSAKGSMIEEAVFGFKYVLERPGLLWLQVVFMMGNFVYNVSEGSLLAPMILARTGNNELIFGTVQTIGAIGGVVGGIAIGAWGGFKRRVHGVLIGWSVSMFFMGLLGLGRANPTWMAIPLWGVTIFLMGLASSLVYASNQSIWQSKVAPDVQGRVFSVRRLIAWLVNPIARLIAGPLADRVMEPAMMEGGKLAPVFGWLVGTGPGAGMGLILLFSGVIGGGLALCGYLIPKIRNVEDDLPDHDAVPVEPVACEAAVAVAAATD